MLEIIQYLYHLNLFYKDMNIQDFIDNFSFAINKKESTVLSCDTNFWDIDEWSSFAALSVMSMIKEEYGIVLRTSDVKGVRTIQELFDVVKERAQ